MPRRSAQTAMYHVAEAMVRWLAPVLAFTAEEIWSSLPGSGRSRCCSPGWHALPEVPLREDDPDWDLVHAVRDDVARELEALRNAGRIGSSLDAELVLYAAPDLAARLRKPGDELRFLLLTSEARVAALEARPADAIALEGFAERLYAQVVPTAAAEVRALLASPARHRQHPEHPEICGRCAGNVSGGEQRRWA
jgi:isoleucyl-tRNA synthetase